MIEQVVNQLFENHLCFGHQGSSVVSYSVLWSKNRDGSQNIGLLTVQPPDVAASPESFTEFSCFEDFYVVYHKLNVFVHM
jgi:hypothetical protein